MYYYFIKKKILYHLKIRYKVVFLYCQIKNIWFTIKTLMQRIKDDYSMAVPISLWLYWEKKPVFHTGTLRIMTVALP